MAGVIRVFGWGSKGVNLVKSPLELADDEATQLQNFEPFREQGLYGIRRRYGLQRVVPIGTVAPTVCPGAIEGSIPIPDSVGFWSPNSMPIYIPFSPGGGISTTNPGTGFNPYTTPTGGTPPTTAAPLIGLAPNVKYKLTASSPYAYVTQFSACPIGSVNAVFQGSASITPARTGTRDWVLGGHQTGEVLRFHVATNTLSRMVQLSGGTGLDDCLILPNPYIFWKPTQQNAALFGQMCAIVALTNGVMALVGVGANGPVVVGLPTLPAQATGGAGQVYDWMFVCAGQTMYAIRPGVDTTWTSVYTTTDAGLVGIVSANNFLYVSATTTATSVNLRVRKFLVASNSLGSVTLQQSGGNDSLQIFQTTAPSAIFGPVAATGGLYIIYIGSNGATLAGFEVGTSPSAGQRSIIRGKYTNTGVSWAVDSDLTADYGSSSNITPGPLVVDPQGNCWTMGRYNITNLAVLRSGIQPVVSGANPPFTWETVYNANPGVEVQFPMFPV